MEAEFSSEILPFTQPIES